MSNPYYAVFNEADILMTPPRRLEPGEAINTAFLDSDSYSSQTSTQFAIDMVEWWDARRDEGWTVAMCNITKVVIRASAKPTIDEIEQAMNNPDLDVEILPDGKVMVATKAENGS